ncbi:prenyltransferase/squalene oxidase repeat-containing protein [Planctomycetota bacterium]
MSKQRHEVRSLSLSRPTLFEEQPWVLQTALFVLFAYLAGIVIARFRFDEPRLAANGGTWLTLLGVTYGLMAVWLNQTKSETVRKGLLLSFFISLILNVSFLVVLSLLNLFVQNELQLAEQPKSKPRKKLVEYDMSNVSGDDRKRREIDAPVETGSPNTDRSEAITKRSVSNMDSEDSVDPSDVASDISLPLPKIRRQLVQTAPRFSDLQGTISRQSIEAEPVVGKPIPHDSPNPQRTQKRVELAASPQQIQRTLPKVAPTPLDMELEITTERQLDTADISRKSNERDHPEMASAEPTLLRRVNTPFTLPNAQLAAASPEATSEDTQPTVLKPEATIQQKTTTASNERRLVTEPLPETPTRKTTRVIERSEIAPPRIEIAKLDQPSPERTNPTTPPTPSATDAPAETGVAKAAATNTTTTPNDAAQEPTATETEIARQAPQPNPSETANTELADAPESPSQPSESSIVRNTPANTPRAVQGAVETTNVERTASSSAAMPTNASPLSDTEQSLANAPVAHHPLAIPTAGPIALSRSIQGVSGSRGEPNFDNEAPAKPSVMTTASASAKRNRASQQTRPGPALAPSDSPTIKRALSQSPTSTASMIARDVPGAVSGGAAQPEAIDASASANVVKASSNAPLSSTTAQPGESNLDFGPTRIASSTGHARASGGGQPTVNLDTAGTSLPRSESQASAVQAQSIQIAEVPMSAAGSGDASETPEPVSPSVGGLVRRTPAPSSSPANSGVVNSAAPSEPESDNPARRLVNQRHSTEIARAQPASAPTMSETVTGGGTSSPRQAPRGHAIVADLSAREVNVTGNPNSTGSSDEPTYRATDLADNRAASGIPQRVQEEHTGALADDVVFDGKSTGASESSTMRRTTSLATETGPTIAANSGQGIPVRRSRSTQLPTAAIAPVTVETRVAGTDATPNDNALELETAIAIGVGETPRSKSGGLLVRVDASEAIGGLLASPATTIGINRRRASPISESIVESPERFVRKQFGGPISVDLTAAVPAKAFQNRLNRKGEAPAGGDGQPSPKTEQAIEWGLVFLAKQQLPDGSWSLKFQGNGQPYPENELALISSDAAATGLCLLSYLGAGYHHVDDKYADVVDEALNFLIEHQNENGSLYVSQDDNSNLSARLYSHAIATIALCEAYGMTQDARLREPAQRALDFIANSQHKTRGGWRYTPGVSSDTSVTGWMMMALKSGELANLKTDEKTFDGIKNWLNRAQASETNPHLYRYNPWAPDTIQQRHGRNVTPTMTSVGLLMRLYSGWRRDRAEMISGANYLKERLPEVGSRSDPKRDTYYWYYATQVMFHMGGEHWQAWNARLHPILTKSQIQSGPMLGSWHPALPVADRWAPHGGRLYVTTLNLLSLEVYYRHLPIYEETAK